MSTTQPSPVLPHEHEEELTYCAVHPDRETSLRCNRCGRYMCVECAVQTPVGYRCRECVRGIEDKYYTATSNDYLSASGACGILTGIATTIVGLIGLPLLFVLILALPVGGAIGEVGLRASKRKRGRQSGIWAVLGTVGGGLVGAMIALYIHFGARMARIPINGVFSLLFSNIGVLLFIGIVAFAVYSRFKVRI